MSRDAAALSLDEDVLIAYLQGGLERAARDALESRLASDSDARRVVAALAQMSIFSASTARDGIDAHTAPEQASSEDRRPPETLPAPRVGEVLADKYRVVGVVGRGAMGIVLDVEHVLLHERYALKLMHGASARDPLAIRRLVREARAAMRIDTPHVARVFDLGALPDGRLFLVMELLTGCDLRSVLAREPAIAIDRAVDYARQAALGVRAAHRAGIVHRDLKPANLFIVHSAQGECLKILDFGLSKAPAIHRGAADDASLTASGSILGSPLYMAPEQIRDPKSADERSDVWALGVVLYEMLIGAPPFTAKTISGVLAAIMVDPPRPFAKVALPPALERTILGCLQKDPADRVPSADALLAELERSNDGDVAHPRIHPPPSRRWRWAGLAAASLGVAASLVAFGWPARPALRAIAPRIDVSGFTAASEAAQPPSEAPPQAIASAAPTASSASRSDRAPEPARPPPVGHRAAPAASVTAAPVAGTDPVRDVVFGKETDERR